MQTTATLDVSVGCTHAGSAGTASRLVCVDAEGGGGGAGVMLGGAAEVMTEAGSA
jgi:hypothetical protein